MSETLGARFVAARTALGWTVEDAAQVLRMRPGLVRDLEANNLQNFSHPSYARLSLLGYARLLRLPLDEVRPWLPDPGSPGERDYQYLEQFDDPKPAARREEVLEQAKAARPLFGLLQIIVFLVVVGLLVYGYIFVLNLNRIGPAGGPPHPPMETEEAAESSAQAAGTPVSTGIEVPVEAVGVVSPALDAEYLQVDLLNPEAARAEETPVPLEQTVNLEIRAALPVSETSLPEGEGAATETEAVPEPSSQR